MEVCIMTITKEERITIIKNNEDRFTEIFNNCENGYAILQLPIEAPYKFRDFEDVTKYLKKMPNRNDYRLIYAVEVDENTWKAQDTITNILDYIYLIYNHGDNPEDYYGTSISVSDVIIVKILGRVFAYYVDAFGFKKLTNFTI